MFLQRSYIKFYPEFECSSCSRTFREKSMKFTLERGKGRPCNKVIKGPEEKDCANGRGSCPEVFYENGALKHFTKCTGKDLCRSLFLITLHVFSLELYQKETPVKVFFFEL